MTGQRSTAARRGFTMVEVLVAMLVALIALAALPATLQITGRAVVLARDGSIAVGLAGAKLEQLLSQADIPMVGTDVISPPGRPTTFTRTWRVEPDLFAGVARSLIATVQWGDGRHEIKLETAGWTP